MQDSLQDSFKKDSYHLISMLQRQGCVYRAICLFLSAYFVALF